MKALKRKMELSAKEISSNFKKNKFDHANGVVELLVHMESSSSKGMLECIDALTEIAVTFIRDGDTAMPALQKPDDLKDAVDKYKDWIQLRYADIVAKFTESLHHKKFAIAERALMSLLTIVREQARADEAFPWTAYQDILSALLSSTINLRNLIKTMQDVLQHEDLAFYSFKVLSSILREEDSPDTTLVYKANLVSLLLLLDLPSTSKTLQPLPLWCSRRPETGVPKEKLRKPHKETKSTLRKAKKQERERASAKLSKKYRKSKYEEVIQQTLYGDEADEQKEDADDSILEEQNDSLIHILDEDEVQKKKDDEEFKSAQKVKKPRKPRSRGLEDIVDDTPEQLIDPNYEPIGERKKIKTSKSDRVLPFELDENMSLKDLINGMSDNDDDNTQGEEEEEEEEDDVGPVFVYNHDRGRQYLTKIWETVMSYTFNEELYKRCLVFIPEKVMKHLLDPIKLTDFFMTSYNMGGGVSLMAMHGVFLLMNKHNLHYPDFYNKVCSLLEPSVFNARYKPRFFMLLNVFLSSSHLPEYMVAAFVKRLSRLLLFAPANCSVLVVKCITNVLARFPSLKILYDDDQEASVACDPYDVGQADLMKTNASKSSLWEVATVGHKAPEKLYKAANFIRRVADLEDLPLNSYLEIEYDELDHMDAEVAEKLTKVTTNFQPVEQLVNNPASNFKTFLDFNK
ncbi:CCAAT-binding factor [Trinorchestia longiramus]|nr:CCAAT-binding factor [Trinorchestia longiramus]